MLSDARKMKQKKRKIYIIYTSAIKSVGKYIRKSIPRLCKFYTRPFNYRNLQNSIVLGVGTCYLTYEGEKEKIRH